MKQPFRQAVGIDVSMDKFDVELGIIDSNFQIKSLYKGQFENTHSGINRFFKTMERKKIAQVPLWYNMEATGVYYEELAWLLSREEQLVSVLLPNKAKLYAKSLDTRSKTDKLDAKMLCRFALERELLQWSAPTLIMWTLKKLNRERLSLVKDSTRTVNQRHAMDYAHIVEKSTYENYVRRSNSRIEIYSSQIKEIESQMMNLVKMDDSFFKAVDRITKVKGLGVLTVVGVIVEANGFNNFQNRNQIVSFAGLDIRLNESGKYKGKTTISKHGNSYIRSMLYMPALSAKKHNTVLGPYYEQLAERKKVKKMATIAVMRKLLVLIFSLYRSGQDYNPNHQHDSLKKEDETLEIHRLESSVLQKKEVDKIEENYSNENTEKILQTNANKEKRTDVSEVKSIKKGRGRNKHPSSVDESLSNSSTETLCFALQI